ncbi:phospholipase D-like domain-containing protein [Ralstonia sp. SM1864_UCD524_TZ4]|uniref:phospholipase D-like domain-containing protein n=1 Tax=Ralstonia solanacearum species complex TaxID=3116862 RepID=UPI001FF7CC8A|nr:phospholipase D-like domain-containing protein [Ralstonia pseudosolanacearum]
MTYLTSNKAARDTILRLAKQCESMAWTVAWATDNDLVETAYKLKAKFSYLLVGTHNYVTSPAVLEKFLGLDSFRVNPPNGSLFHPKVYTFDLGGETAAVIGSHNLTASAFTENIEASVLLTGSPHEQAFVDLHASITKRWGEASEISREWLHAYRANCRRVEPSRKELERWVPTNKPQSAEGKVSTQNLDWTGYVASVKVDPTHGIEGRLHVLERIAKIFRGADTFEALHMDDRKRIAGTTGKKLERSDGVTWRWFGAMRRNSSFATLVNNRPARFSQALECIPFAGPVTLEDYERYVKKFKAAFVNTPKSGGLATGTRLLAMKRPDQFVCVDGPNRKGICADFGQAPTTLSLANYWQRVIEPMRQTSWWLHPRPLDTIERRIWDCRAAMLDAIHYDPKEKSNKRGAG